MWTKARRVKISGKTSERKPRINSKFQQKSSGQQQADSEDVPTDNHHPISAPNHNRNFNHKKSEGHKRGNKNPASRKPKGNNDYKEEEEKYGDKQGNANTRHDYNQERGQQPHSGKVRSKESSGYSAAKAKGDYPHHKNTGGGKPKQKPYQSNV